MKVTIKLDTDWEIEAEIPDDVAEKLNKKEEVKQTGYERVELGGQYYYANCRSDIEDAEEEQCMYDDGAYETGNYYTSKTLAENNARADTLMRQLRRFSVEHREKELDWTRRFQNKYYIYYDHDDLVMHSAFNYKDCAFGLIYFDSRDTADLAIQTFYDELIWYFTEYKDSL